MDVDLFLKVSAELDAENLQNAYLILSQGEYPARCHAALQEVLVSILQRVVTFETGNEFRVSIANFIMRKLDDNMVRNIGLQLIYNQTSDIVNVCVEEFHSRKMSLTEEECEKLNELFEFESKTTEEIDFLSKTAIVYSLIKKSQRISRYFLVKMLNVFKEHNNISCCDIPEVFYKELATIDVGHPLIIYYAGLSRSPISIFPQVFSLEQEFKIVSNSMFGFIFETPLPDASSLVLCSIVYLSKLLDRGLKLSSDLISLCSDIWSMVFAYCNSLDYSDMTKLPPNLRLFANSFDNKSRPLFLKRILHILLVEKKCISYEPQVVAVIVDEYKHNLKIPEFVEELGDFWSVISRFKYENIYNASSFYSSIFVFATTLAVSKINPPLLKVLRDEILTPAHDQISDFVQVKTMQKNKHETQEENLGSEMFDLVMFSYDRAIATINEVLRDCL